MIEELFSTLPTPPAAGLLGWRFLAWDDAAATLTVGFDGSGDFTNPAGNIQGGLLAAMLDDAMGPAILAASGGKRYGHTIDLQMQFLRPVPPGPLRATGRVVRMGRSVAYLEGALYRSDGALAARGMASASLTDMSDIAASG